MPKGSKPYPYSRAPKTGGMPPMNKPKPKAKPKATRSAAPKATPRVAPKPSPWFDPKTGRAVKAAETAGKAAARAAPVAARAAGVGRLAAAGARVGAAVGGRAGVVGIVGGLVVGGILGVAKGMMDEQKAKRNAALSKGPKARNKGRSPTVSTPPAVAASLAVPPTDFTKQSTGKAQGLSAFGKAFKEAEYNRRKKGGPATFMFKGKSYAAAQKGRKY